MLDKLNNKVKERVKLSLSGRKKKCIAKTFAKTNATVCIE